jgi:hypothetical protein
MQQQQIEIVHNWNVRSNIWRIFAKRWRQNIFFEIAIFGIHIAKLSIHCERSCIYFGGKTFANTFQCATHWFFVD